MAIAIQMMTTDDYQDAFQLWQSLPGLGLSSADQKHAIAHFIDRNPNSCFVAKDGEKVIGTVLGGNDGRRGYIYHLAVQEDYQGKGLGKQLSETCIAALKSEGLQKCHIFVIKDNQKGLRFWKRLGWLLREDILVLSKDL